MATDIDKVYREELGRKADASGLKTYAGMSEDKLRKTLRGSEEYKKRSGGGGGGSISGTGGSIVHSDRGDKFDKSGLKEIGQTGTGITGKIDLGAVGSENLSQVREKGAVILYDDVTGKLYATNDWSDVQKNWDSLVDSTTGQRQKLFGISSRTVGGENQYYAHHVKKTKPFGVDVTVGYNEVIPEAGTEEFQDWVNKKFYEGVEEEKAQHVWTQESGWGGNKPGYGDYFSISYEDWMSIGAPRKHGDLRLDFGGGSKEKNREIQQNLIDAEGRVNPNFMLGGANFEDESHGVTKILNSVGSVWGNNEFGEDVVEFSNNLAEVPILGSLSLANKLFLQPIAKYEGARDAGESSASALHDTGSYMLATSAKMGVEAVIVALGAVLAPFTAGLSAVAAGAALGALNAAGSYGIDSLVYGGTYAENAYGGDIWDATGKGAAAGAITAGVAQGANFIAPNAAGGYYNVGGEGAYNVVSIPTDLSSLTHAAIVGAGQYASSRIVYGATDSQAMWAGVGGALSGYSQTQTAKDAQTKQFLEAHPQAAKYLTDSTGAIEHRSAFSGKAWGNSWTAFRNVAAESPLTSRLFGGGGTETGAYMRAAEAGGFKRPGIVSSVLGISPYARMFGIGRNLPAEAMSATSRKDFISRITGITREPGTTQTHEQMSDIRVANAMFDIYHTKDGSGNYVFSPEVANARAADIMFNPGKPRWY